MPPSASHCSYHVIQSAGPIAVSTGGVYTLLPWPGRNTKGSVLWFRSRANSQNSTATRQDPPPIITCDSVRSGRSKLKRCTPNMSRISPLRRSEVASCWCKMSAAQQGVAVAVSSFILTVCCLRLFKLVCCRYGCRGCGRALSLSVCRRGGRINVRCFEMLRAMPNRGPSRHFGRIWKLLLEDVVTVLKEKPHQSSGQSDSLLPGFLLSVSLCLFFFSLSLSLSLSFSTSFSERGSACLGRRKHKSYIQ